MVQFKEQKNSIKQMIVVDIYGEIYGNINSDEDAQYKLYELEQKGIPAAICEIIGWNNPKQ